MRTKPITPLILASCLTAALLSSCAAPAVDTKFGERTLQSAQQVHRASTDGFVTAYRSQPAGDESRIMVQVGTSENLTPRETVAGARLMYEDVATVTVPVREGEYWKVVGSPESPVAGTVFTVYWTPLERSQRP